LMWLYQN